MRSMYVCVHHVRPCVCTHVRVYNAWTYVCMLVCDVGVCVHPCVCIARMRNMCVYPCASMHVCMRVCDVCVCPCVWVCVADWPSVASATCTGRGIVRFTEGNTGARAVAMAEPPTHRGRIHVSTRTLTPTDACTLIHTHACIRTLIHSHTHRCVHSH